MTQKEILQEFSQLSIKQQLELLRTALEIVELNFAQAEQSDVEELSTADLKNGEDPLFAMAGFFESPVKNVSRDHDKYLGENLSDNHV